MDDSEEIHRLLNVLRTSIRLLGLTNREIERRLDLTPSYVSRLFAGALELKMEHVLSISRAMGLQPWEFFQLAYPRRSDAPSDAFLSIRRVLRDMQPTPTPEQESYQPGLTHAEVEEKIHRFVRKAIQDLGLQHLAADMYK